MYQLVHVCVCILSGYSANLKQLTHVDSIRHSVVGLMEGIYFYNFPGGKLNIQLFKGKRGGGGGGVPFF